MCRCDERLKGKTEGKPLYTSLIHWVPRGTTSSIFKIIRTDTSLTRILTIFDFNWKENTGGSGRVHCLIAQSELLKMKKNGQFPDEIVRIEVIQIHYQCSLPDDNPSIQCPHISDPGSKPPPESSPYVLGWNESVIWSTSSRELFCLPSGWYNCRGGPLVDQIETSGNHKPREVTPSRSGYTGLLGKVVYCCFYESITTRLTYTGLCHSYCHTHLDTSVWGGGRRGNWVFRNTISVVIHT